MKVYVVVLNWNGKDLIGACIDSLLDQTQGHTIVVVDNGSSDGSVEFLDNKYSSKIELIKEKTNHGFAGGVNIGTNYAIKNKADFVALLNNDAAADKRWLENLVNVFSVHDKVGIVTGKLLREDKNHIDSTGDFYSIWGMPFPRGRNQIDSGQFNKTEEVFGASGGASLYRVKMLEEIGLFDEKFFAYYEDVDISFRARLADWKILFNPDAVAYHKVSATSSKMHSSFTRYHSVKNLLMLYGKNMPGFLFWKYFPLFVLQMIRLAISSLAKGGFLTYIKAVLRFILWSPAVFKNRLAIQKSRKVKISEIDALLYHQRPPKIPPFFS